MFKKKMLVLLIVLIGLNVLYAQTISFQKRVICNDLPLASGLSYAFIDEDQSVDVVAGSAGNVNALCWYSRMAENAEWESFVIDNAISGVLQTCTGDFNSDGKTDIAVAASGSNQIAVYYQVNSTPISWIKQVIDSDFMAAHEIYCADLDGDSDLDLVGAAAVSDEISVWINQGGNPCVWQNSILTSTANGARSAYISDLNGDSVQEIITAALENNKISLWSQLDIEPYWQEYVVDSQLTGAHRVRSVDVDNDGLKDIIAQAYTSNKVVWYKNNGGASWSFTKYIIDSTCPHALDVLAADLNNEGICELLSTSQSGNTIAYYSRNENPPFTWTKTIISDTFQDPWRLEAVDMDDDGDLDILAVSFQGNSVVYWENQFISCDFTVDNSIGHAPLLVSFNNLSTDTIPYTGFAWDFNGDGVTDSNLENPSYNYTQAGSYTVSLTVSNALHTFTKTYENLVKVFNGESSLLFNTIGAKAINTGNEHFNLQRPFSLECWVNLSGWGPNALNGYGYILDKRKFAIKVKKESGSTNGNCLMLTLNNSEGAVVNYTENNSINLNQWNHIAISYSENSEMKVYMNGVETGLSLADIPDLDLADNSAYPLIVGNSSTGTFTFDGCIDELRIWNRVISHAEINANLNQWVEANKPGLIGYWRFNEAWGNLAEDLTGDYDLELQNVGWAQGVIENQVNNHDQELSMSKNSLSIYPNPFNPITNIAFNIDKNATCKLEIFNIKGQLLDVLCNTYLEKGHHSFVWNGKNNRHESMSSGIYFVRMTSDNKSVSKKLVLIK